MKRIFTRPLLLILASFVTISCGRKSVAPDESNGAQGMWFLFVPLESLHANCAITEDVPDAPSGGKGVRLHSSEKARFAFRKNEPALRVAEGERYRLSVWAKIDRSASVEPSSPGVVIRATMFRENHVSSSLGHIYLTTKGAASRSVQSLLGSPPPYEWTKIEGEIAIPKGIVEMKLYVFCWYTSGSVYFDSPMAVKLAGVEKSASK